MSLYDYCKKNHIEEILSEWDYEKNYPATPKTVNYNSKQKYYWKCLENRKKYKKHSYLTAVRNKTRNRGPCQCNICAGKHVEPGINDLLTTHPEIAKEWDYSVPCEYSPETISAGSNFKAPWKCSKCGYQWKAPVKARCRGTGCKNCCNRVLKPGVNDLATVNPTLAAQWDYNKNKKKPSDYFPNSNEIVYWKCPKCGYSWRASIDKRNAGTGCVKCNNANRTSFPEYALFYFLKRIDNHWIHTYRDKGFEIDMFNPKLQIGVEYDGSYYHKKKESSDNHKNELCKSLNITLYRIREGLPELNGDSIDILCDEKTFPIAIESLIDKIYGQKLKVNIQKHLSEILRLISREKVENSLKTTNPELIHQWDYEKNGGLTPENVTAGSEILVSWICNKCENSYQATICSRAKKHTGCPYCSNKKLKPGTNDLATRHPEILKLWNYKKNKGKKPSQFFSSDTTKVYWLFEDGHESFSSIKYIVNKYGRKNKIA